MTKYELLRTKLNGTFRSIHLAFDIAPVPTDDKKKVETMQKGFFKSQVNEKVKQSPELKSLFIDVAVNQLLDKLYEDTDFTKPFEAKDASERKAAKLTELLINLFGDEMDELATGVAEILKGKGE